VSESRNIHEEIARWVESGERDPLTIARKTIKSKGELWVAEQLLFLGEEILSEMARSALSRVRRSKEIAIRPADPVTTLEIKKAKVWVPTKGYIAFDEVTVDDAALRARWYMEAARQLTKRAVWWAQIHELMVERGAKTLGDLDDLPPLPEDFDYDVPGMLAAPKELTS
jgi:hypothetical protein